MVALSGAGKSVTLFPEREAVPSESKENLVVQTWSFSLVVNDVRQVSKEVINYTQEIGGFMVSASLFLNKKGEKIAPVADWLVVKLAPAREHFTSAVPREV